MFDPSKSFTIEGLEFTPLAAHHGIYLTTKEPYICYGFKFGDVSYISDTNFIPAETMALIQEKSRVFVVDCLRCKGFFLLYFKLSFLVLTPYLVTNPHASHFVLDQSIEAAREVNASKTYLVGFAHRADHYQIETMLKELETIERLKIAPAYDGLKVSLVTPGKLIESSYFEPTPIVVTE